MQFDRKASWSTEHLKEIPLKHGLALWHSCERIHLQCRRPGFNPWVGKISWRREWHQLQCSCLENPTDRGAWQATVQSGAKSHTQRKRQHAHTVSILYFPPTCYHDPLPSKPLEKKAASTFKMDCFTCISLKFRE